MGGTRIHTERAAEEEGVQKRRTRKTRGGGAVGPGAGRKTKINLRRDGGGGRECERSEGERASYQMRVSCTGLLFFLLDPDPCCIGSSVSRAKGGWYGLAWAWVTSGGASVSLAKGGA